MAKLSRSTAEVIADRLDDAIDELDLGVGTLAILFARVCPEAYADDAEWELRKAQAASIREARSAWMAGGPGRYEFGTRRKRR